MYLRKGLGQILIRVDPLIWEVQNDVEALRSIWTLGKPRQDGDCKCNEVGGISEETWKKVLVVAISDKTKG